MTDFPSRQITGGLIEGFGIRVAEVVLAQGVEEPVVVQPLVGSDVDGAAESSIDDDDGGVGGDASYVDDEGGKVFLTQKFFFQLLSCGVVQVGLEGVISQSFDDVTGRSDKDGWGVDEGEVDGGPDEADSGLEALLGEDAANLLFYVFFGEGLDVVALGPEVSEGFMDVVIGVVRMDLNVVYPPGEVKEAGGGLFGRAGPGDDLDATVPPFIEEVGCFPLEEAPAVRGGGQVSCCVAVSALGNDKDKEDKGDEGEGSLHGLSKACVFAGCNWRVYLKDISKGMGFVAGVVGDHEGRP